MTRDGARKALAMVAAGTAVAAMGTGVAGAAGPQLTLHANHPYVKWGQPLILSGVETSAGHPVAGATVKLLANRFPFTGGFAAIRTVVTNAHGAYQFTVRPNRATRYRAAASQSATSGVVTAYVVPSDVATCNLCNFHNTPGTHTLSVSDVYTVPPGTASAFSGAYLYYGQTNGSQTPPATLRLVKTGPLTQIAASKLRDAFSYQVHFPAGRFEFEYVTCFKNHEASTGIGLPGNHHCGDAVLTQSELGYVG